VGTPHITHVLRSFYQVHPYKTGGTSIRHCLNITGLRHQTAHQIINDVGREAWGEAFTFTVVRNPYDRLVSFYHYVRRKRYMLDRSLDFEGFVRRKLVDGRPVLTVQKARFWMPVANWIYEGGKCLVDYVGRFEQLQGSFDVICDRIGRPRETLPHVNRTDHAHYSTYYTPGLREVVDGSMQSDCEAFGYTFSVE